MELLDIVEYLAYFTAFWLFLCSPVFRRRRIGAFRRARPWRRGIIAIEGCVAAACGLLPVTLLGFAAAAW